MEKNSRKYKTFYNKQTEMFGVLEFELGILAPYECATPKLLGIETELKEFKDYWNCLLTNQKLDWEELLKNWELIEVKLKM